MWLCDKDHVATFNGRLCPLVSQQLTAIFVSLDSCLTKLKMRMSEFKSRIYSGSIETELATGQDGTQDGVATPVCCLVVYIALGSTYGSKFMLTRV